MSKSSCLTVGDFLDTYIGTILNDRDGEHACSKYEQWPSHSRFTAYKEAICRLREMRPDAFSEKVEITLVAGQMQEAPEGYERILSIGFNGDGTKISELDQRSNVFNDQISGLPIGCAASASGSYSASSAEVDANNVSSFCVTPSVSTAQAKAGASVIATVIKDAECMCLDDCVPDAFKAAITDWVLFRMYSFETDSEMLLQKASMHRSSFDSIVDKQYRYLQAQGSGYWKGAIGSGDGSFRARTP